MSLRTTEGMSMGCMFIALAIGIAALVGEVKCIIKAVNCNYEPVGKAEIFYVASACTGLGCITGYIDVEDK